MQLITKSGMYDGIPSDVYHSDCCDGPSLSSSGARDLVMTCPALYKYRRDNPTTSDAFDIGTATHLLVLEPSAFHANIGIVPYDDYRKKEAKTARDDIRASGRTPLLPEHLVAVESMRHAIYADPVAQELLSDADYE